MRVTQIEGLYVGTANAYPMDFNILIAAYDIEAAKEAAREYFQNSDIEYSKISVTTFNDICTDFDCDYIIVAD